MHFDQDVTPMMHDIFEWVNFKKKYNDSLDNLGQNKEKQKSE